jgi:hypothetical protein
VKIRVQMSKFSQQEFSGQPKNGPRTIFWTRVSRLRNKYKEIHLSGKLIGVEALEREIRSTTKTKAIHKFEKSSPIHTKARTVCKVRNSAHEDENL